MILSNGLGNIETLEKYVDRQKIYAGVTLWSSELEGSWAYYGHRYRND